MKPMQKLCVSFDAHSEIRHFFRRCREDLTLAVHICIDMNVNIAVGVYITDEFLICFPPVELVDGLRISRDEKTRLLIFGSKRYF